MLEPIDLFIRFTFGYVIKCFHSLLVMLLGEFIHLLLNNFDNAAHFITHEISVITIITNIITNMLIAVVFTANSFFASLLSFILLLF